MSGAEIPQLAKAAGKRLARVNKRERKCVIEDEADGVPPVKRNKPSFPGWMVGGVHIEDVAKAVLTSAPETTVHVAFGLPQSGVGVGVHVRVVLRTVRAMRVMTLPDPRATTPSEPMWKLPSKIPVMNRTPLFTSATVMQAAAQHGKSDKVRVGTMINFMQAESRLSWQTLMDAHFCAERNHTKGRHDYAWNTTCNACKEGLCSRAHAYLKLKAKIADMHAAQIAPAPCYCDTCVAMSRFWPLLEELNAAKVRHRQLLAELKRGAGAGVGAGASAGNATPTVTAKPPSRTKAAVRAAPAATGDRAMARRMNALWDIQLHWLEPEEEEQWDAANDALLAAQWKDLVVQWEAAQEA